MKRESMYDYLQSRGGSFLYLFNAQNAGEKAIVFSHTTIKRNCKSCGELLAEPSVSKANIVGKVLEAQTSNFSARSMIFS